MAWTSQGGGGEPDRVALLRELIDRHAPALDLYARQWVEDAEDIVQECLVKLAAQHHPPDHPVAWLYRAVRNRAISAARSAHLRHKHESALAQTRSDWFVTTNGQAIDARTATESLRLLPLEEREVIVSHLWGGLTFEQIAEVADCSPSTAHRRYLAALQKLRERLRVP